MARSGSRLRRIVTRVIVFLLLGAIVNVVVAWGCRELEVNRRYAYPPLRTADISFWQARKLCGWPDKPQNYSITYTFGATLLNYSASYYLEPDGTALYDKYYPPHIASWVCGILCESHSGWPLQGMCSTKWYIEGDAESEHRGIIRGWYRGEGWHDFRPLWPDFAINTLFYPAILWLLFAAPFALRRWRRIRRGLCPKCGYPIGDSPVCTECGAAVNPLRRNKT